MYVRFVSPLRAGNRTGAYGLFRGAMGAVYHEDTPTCLRDAVELELDWFNEHLPRPRYSDFEIRSRKRWYADGICWFRDDAQEMIARAFVLAGLLRDCGVNISKLATDRPGQILYRDDYQIVAKPAAETPVLWC